MNLCINQTPYSLLDGYPYYLYSIVHEIPLIRSQNDAEKKRLEAAIVSYLDSRIKEDAV